MRQPKTSAETGKPSLEKRGWLWRLFVVMVTVIAGLFLAWLSNKLLIEEVVKRATTRIYAPALSLFYPSTGQSALTVVTLDDADLQEYGLQWPVALDYYQRLLDGILKRSPKAIFLDVLFLDNKPEKEIQSLVAAACRSTEAGVPFFLATFGLPDLTSNAEMRLFEAKTPAGVSCAIPVRANISPDSLDQSQWAYPLKPAHGGGVHGSAPVEATHWGRGELDSVALTLFCTFNPTQCPKNAQTPLALIWATKSAPTNVDIMVERKASGALGHICRGSWNWWEVIPGTIFFHDIASEPFLPLCPYNQVVPVRAFKSMGFSAQELDDALRGKIVLIGADLKAVGDNVFSPVHGRLPGIHVHAMALDNLISFGGAYKENGEFEWHALLKTKANQFVAFSLLLISATMVFWKSYRDEKSRKNNANQPIAKTNSKRVRSAGKYPAWKMRLSRVGMVLLSPLLIVAGWPRFNGPPFQPLLAGIGVLVYLLTCTLIFWVGYFMLDQGPLSLIEYVLFPLMAHFLHVGEHIAERASQFWRSLDAPDPWHMWASLGE